MEIKLTITLAGNGEVSVTGPVDNRVLCYGLLEAGRDAVKQHCDELAKSPIQLVGANALPQNPSKPPRPS